MPMDETLAAAAVDLGGRPYCVVNAKITAKRVGDFQSELTEDFFPGICTSCPRQRSSARTLRPLVSSPSRGHVQSVRARTSLRCFTRQAPSQRSPQHEGPSMNVTLIDYGAGNVTSVERALQRLGAASLALQFTGVHFAKPNALLLPGVGHYAALIRALDERALRAPLLDAIRAWRSLSRRLSRPASAVRNQRRSSRTHRPRLFSGSVRSLPATVKLPHMGWNQLQLTRPSRLLAGNLPLTRIFISHIRTQRPKKLPTEKSRLPARMARISPPSSKRKISSRFSSTRKKAGKPGARLLQNFLRLAA